jgi:ribosome-binding protein aMBF1 (putative translation factor)
MNTTTKLHTNHCEVCGSEFQARYTAASVAKGNVRAICHNTECATEGTRRHNGVIIARESARVSIPRAPRREAQATGEWGMIGMMLGQVKKGGRTL